MLLTYFQEKKFVMATKSESTQRGSKKQSTEEEDLVTRSTKKVKTKEGEKVSELVSMVLETREDANVKETTEPLQEMEGLESQPKEKESYRDKLLNINREEENELILEAMKDISGPEWIQWDSMNQGEDIEFNPYPTVNISLVEAEEWCRPWKQALIMNLMGKKIGLKTLQTRLEKNWSRKGPIKVIGLSDDYLLVHFQQEDDYKFALFEGPWMIYDHYFIVQRWRPFFKCGKEKVQKLAVWIRIPNLLIELCNAKFLWRVGSHIGTMLKVDNTTSIQTRAKFARIWVELDLRKQLIPKFKVLSYEFKVEYEGLHLICFQCGKYGHRAEACCETIKPPEPIPVAMAQEVREDPSTGKKDDLAGTDILIIGAEN